MSQRIDLYGGPSYLCDSCGTMESRVLTDSHTGLDFCFGCVSGHGTKGGLFWGVTQDPVEDDGDNLIDAMEQIGMDTDRIKTVLHPDTGRVGAAKQARR